MFHRGQNIQKIKMDYILLKNQYSILPIFHYSMNEVKTQTSNNTTYFYKLYKFRDGKLCHI